MERKTPKTSPEVLAKLLAGVNDTLGQQWFSEEEVQWEKSQAKGELIECKIFMEVVKPFFGLFAFALKNWTLEVTVPARHKKDQSIAARVTLRYEHSSLVGSGGGSVGFHMMYDPETAGWYAEDDYREIVQARLK